MDAYSAPTLILVDASHLMYRSWNTLSQLKSSTGIPTGTQFGVARTLISLQKKHPSAHIVFVLDGSSILRRELSSTYKAHRTPDKDVYAPEAFSHIKTIVRGLGVSIAYHPDYEADDLIANLSLDLRFPAQTRYIYSGDDDFNQLVRLGRIGVWLWKPGSGKERAERILGPSDVFDDWGVDPYGLPLYRSFTGDGSDEIRGLPRVPRSPLKLAVANHVTPEAFYTWGLAYFTEEWRQRLIEFRPTCELNFKLTRLPFAEITTPLELNRFDAVSLRQVFQELEFNSMLKKFDELQSLFSPEVTCEQISHESNGSELRAGNVS